VRASDLNYCWTLCFLVAGANKTPVWARKIIAEWKPLLWFTKGKYTGKRILTDVLSGKPEKGLHAWQQPEDLARLLVQWFSEPGELVLDPCVGSGTFGVAALQEERRFVGIDIDQNALKVAASRLADVPAPEQKPDVPR